MAPKSSVSEEAITKRIPLANVRNIPGTNPRLKIDPNQVDNFYELYLNDDTKDVPPIEVLLVQNGDPRSHVYLVLDGLHRIDGAKKAECKDIFARVRLKPEYTLEDLDLEKVRTAILLLACPYNSDGRLPLTPVERRIAAEKFFDQGYPDNVIAKALKIGLRTARSLIEAIKRSKREAIKLRLAEHMERGGGAKSFLKQLSLKERQGLLNSTSAVKRWAKQILKAKEDKGGHFGNDRQNGPPESKPPASSFPPLASGDETHTTEGATDLQSDTSTLGSDLSGDEPKGPTYVSTNGADDLSDDAREKLMTILGNFRDSIRTSRWCPDATHYVILDVLPVLGSRDPELKKALHVGGLNELYDAATSRLAQREADVENMRKTIRDKNAEIAKLHEINKKHKQECKSDCDYTKDATGKLYEDELHFIIERLESYTDAITKRRYFGGKKKKMQDLPDAALPFARQMALEFAFTALSHFEVAEHKLIKLPSLVTLGNRFVRLIEDASLDEEKDIYERVDRLRATLSIN